MLSRATRCKSREYGVSPYRFSRRRSPFLFLREEELPIFVVIDLRLLTVTCVTLLKGQASRILKAGSRDERKRGGQGVELSQLR